MYRVDKGHSIFLVLVALIVLSFNVQWPSWQQDANAQSNSPNRKLLKVGDKLQHINGMNLPWLDGACGHDFGLNPVRKDAKLNFSEENLATYFADMRKMHVNVVRIFVFEDLEGLVFDSNGFVESLDQNLLDNFDIAVKLAREHHLHLYLTLAHNFIAKCKQGEFKNIITSEKARRSYLDNAVEPFVARYKEDPTVFAIDIMNEPEREIAGKNGNWQKEGCNWDQMRIFLRENVVAIRKADSSRLISCGSGFHGPNNLKAGLYSKLGLDFYDFHEYNDKGTIPPAAELRLDRPVLLGEFGQDGREKSVDDRRQVNAVAAFLRNARDGGYAGAAMWCYDHPGAQDFQSVLRGNGDSEWRPACETIRDFRWDPSAQ